MAETVPRRACLAATSTLWITSASSFFFDALELVGSPILSTSDADMVREVRDSSAVSSKTVPDDDMFGFWPQSRTACEKGSNR